jgi:hypothetical protein
MAYARFGASGSDVYLYGGWTREGDPDDPHTHVIVCCMCLLLPSNDTSPGEWGKSEWESVDFTTQESLFVHLDAHQAAGHHVPERAMQRIREDNWIS